MSGMPPVFGRGPLVGISSTALSGVLVRGASSSGSPALATALGVEASATPSSTLALTAGPSSKSSPSVNSPSVPSSFRAFRSFSASSRSSKSGRTIRLTPGVRDALKRHRTRQAEERLKAGYAYQDGGLAFATKCGTPINPSNLRSRSFAPLLKKAGLPQITFHDLRHTTASLLFSKNVHPKFVQELLGHASVAFTLDTYSHMLPGMGGEAADAMGDALG